MTAMGQFVSTIRGLLVAWRGDVQDLASCEFHARCAEVQFHASLMAVPDPEHVELVAVQTCKGKSSKASMMGCCRTSV
ncbi:hypothetical protein [uncultured Roseibium sp.]|uniref:hypothetical protein n=1 Tax=uncultured Roseibium sp. TaxID=1936171 RepID=UPI0026083EAE|nr:hypothetical protein [uncultured Roseibium sp.]